MRLWSIHPSYLDRQGLLAVWREGLLAQSVLLGYTKGYRNHPQLDRFKISGTPLSALSFYMYNIFLEVKNRGYKFNETKIYSYGFESIVFNHMTVTKGQLKYEFRHLYNKLMIRDKRQARKIWYNCYPLAGILHTIPKIKPHPLFEVVEGDIESWEKVK
jgi:hypothetical protein